MRPPVGGAFARGACRADSAPHAPAEVREAREGHDIDRAVERELEPVPAGPEPGRAQHRGLEGLAEVVAAHPATGRFCHGDTPGLADCVLVPQVFNARRFDCRLDHVPTVTRIAAACEALDAFARAAPAAQPEAE